MRFVLDDDKVHCDGIKVGSWDTIKKVKHVVCNHNGANIHSLASSVTGIVYSICTERNEHKRVFDCVGHCLTSAFRGRNSYSPNLNNVILALDRGYNCFKELVSFVKSCGGETFGTSKRTLFNIFTFDQKRRGDWDKRLFRKKEGARIVERRVAKLKTGDKNHIGDMISLFYHNGFGGAVLMQSTLETDKADMWDRQISSSSKFFVNDPSSFYVPHSLFCNNVPFNVMCQKMMHDSLKEKIDIVTAEQNVFEWFISRMFCVTASPAQNYLSLGLKKEEWMVQDHWKKIKAYVKCPKKYSHVDTLISEVSDLDVWAKKVFLDDIDGIHWMKNLDNLKKLERDSLHDILQKQKWVALCKGYKICVFGKKDGFTNINANIICDWANMSDEHKSIAKFNTIENKRKELKRRLLQSNPDYNNIKTMSGKYTSIDCINPEPILCHFSS